MILPLYSTLVRQIWSVRYCYGLPGETGAMNMGKGLEHLLHEERLRELELFSLEAVVTLFSVVPSERTRKKCAKVEYKKVHSYIKEKKRCPNE